MKKLIYLEDAIEELRKMANKLYGYDASVILSSAIYRLENLPSAEPERKTEYWIKRTRIYESGTCPSYDPEWYCSECRTKYDPHFFTAKEVQSLPVRIMGVVVEIRRKVRRK